MAKETTDIHVNENGLSPIKFLGVPTDPENPDTNRAGEAGLGLRVGEIRGVAPEVARRMIKLGTAEAVFPAKAAAKPAA
jgi:hypothetical protein